MKKHLAMLLMASALMNGQSPNQRREVIEPEDTPKREPPIPIGCKRYYYNKEGLCSKEQSLFYCDAMKPSSANRKYQNWKSKLINP